MKEVKTNLNPKPFFARIVSLLVAEAFLCSSLLPAWANPVDLLRPKTTAPSTLVGELKQAKDGEGKESFILGNGKRADLFLATKEYLLKHKDEMESIDTESETWEIEGQWKIDRFLEDVRSKTGTPLLGKWDHFYIVEMDGKPVGYVVGTYENDDFPVSKRYPGLFGYRLSVHPEYRKSKIGTLLIHKLAESAKERGKEYLTLETWEKNSGSQRLYEKIGFKKVGERFDDAKQITFFEYVAPTEGILKNTGRELSQGGIQKVQSEAAEDGGGKGVLAGVFMGLAPIVMSTLLDTPKVPKGPSPPGNVPIVTDTLKEVRAVDSLTQEYTTLFMDGEDWWDRGNKTFAARSYMRGFLIKGAIEDLPSMWEDWKEEKITLKKFYRYLADYVDSVVLAPFAKWVDIGASQWTRQWALDLRELSRQENPPSPNLEELKQKMLRLSEKVVIFIPVERKTRDSTRVPLSHPPSFERVPSDTGKSKDGGERGIPELLNEAYEIAKTMPSTDDPKDAAEWREYQIGDHRIYVLGVTHGTSKALALMKERFIPRVQEDPQKWIFVTEEFDSESARERIVSPETGYPDSYLLDQISKILKIPVQGKVVRKYQRIAVQETLREKDQLGFTEEELYQAMAWDIFPMIDLGEGRIGFQASMELLDTVSLLYWGLQPTVLYRMMHNLQSRYLSEGETYLNTLRLLLQRLVQVGNDLTRERMKELIQYHPDRPNVFVLTGWEHLPAFEKLAVSDGGNRRYPKADEPGALAVAQRALEERTKDKKDNHPLTLLKENSALYRLVFELEKTHGPLLPREKVRRSFDTLEGWRRYIQERILQGEDITITGLEEVRSGEEITKLYEIERENKIQLALRFSGAYPGFKPFSARAAKAIWVSLDPGEKTTPKKAAKKVLKILNTRPWQERLILLSLFKKHDLLRSRTEAFLKTEIGQKTLDSFRVKILEETVPHLLLRNSRNWRAMSTNRIVAWLTLVPEGEEEILEKIQSDEKLLAAWPLFLETEWGKKVSEAFEEAEIGLLPEDSWRRTLAKQINKGEIQLTFDEEELLKYLLSRGEPEAPSHIAEEVHFSQGSHSTAVVEQVTASLQRKLTPHGIRISRTERGSLLLEKVQARAAKDGGRHHETFPLLPFIRPAAEALSYSP